MSNIDARYGHLSSLQRNEIFHALQDPDTPTCESFDRLVRRQMRKYGLPRSVIMASYHHSAEISFARRVAEAKRGCRR
jgi:hypothetical protein